MEKLVPSELESMSVGEFHFRKERNECERLANRRTALIIL